MLCVTRGIVVLVADASVSLQLPVTDVQVYCWKFVKNSVEMAGGPLTALPCNVPSKLGSRRVQTEKLQVAKLLSSHCPLFGNGFPTSATRSGHRMFA
jgi:hypothetical protein